MTIPAFDRTGNLPVGVFSASMNEVRVRFGAGARRSVLFQRLERIHTLARATGALHRFVIFGSIVTSKPAPNDVDLFLLMSDHFDAAHLSGETRIAFDHLAADAYFGCSVFWVRRLAALGGEQATIEHWQNCRGSGRGIIEVVETNP